MKKKSELFHGLYSRLKRLESDLLQIVDLKTAKERLTTERSMFEEMAVAMQLLNNPSTPASPNLPVTSPPASDNIIAIKQAIDHIDYLQNY